MSQRIVSNTGPLITLEKLEDGHEFIRKLYDKIIIPQKVLEEISEKYSTGEDYLKKYQIEDLIEVYRVTNIVDIRGIESLDDGEIEAISLALELKLELLIEEIKGRKIAQSVGISISGIAGQIGRACIKGIINKTEAIQKLQKLLEMGRINQEVYTEVVSTFE